MESDYLVHNRQLALTGSVTHMTTLVRLQVRANTHARRTTFRKKPGGTPVAWTAAGPVANNANRPVVRLPARSFGLRQQNRLLQKGICCSEKQMKITTSNPLALHAANAELAAAL